MKLFIFPFWIIAAAAGALTLGAIETKWCNDPSAHMQGRYDGTKVCLFASKDRHQYRQQGG